MSLIELRGASRLWDATAGLHAIDLQVDSGELVVVRGRSGSGKSTLLALVAGICEPGGGDVLVLGGQPRRDMPWSDVALVPQVMALSAELSIGENVADCAPGVDPSRIADLLGRLGVLELVDRTIDEVSMGQQQRAAARAMVVDPKVLLADEPTSFQDEANSIVVVDALRHAASNGTAVLVATHDDLVAGAADRVIELTSAG